MMPRGPADDRGLPCSISRLTPGQVGWRSLGIPRLTKDPTTRAEQARTAGLETAAGIAGGVIGAVVYELTLSATLRSIGGFAADLGGQMVCAIAAGMTAWYAALGPIRRAVFSKIAPIYLAERRCPSCGYDLSDLPPEPDACVLCPECNAAWKSDRLGREA